MKHRKSKFKRRTEKKRKLSNDFENLKLGEADFEKTVRHILRVAPMQKSIKRTSKKTG